MPATVCFPSTIKLISSPLTPSTGVVTVGKCSFPSYTQLVVPHVTVISFCSIFHFISLSSVVPSLHEVFVLSKSFTIAVYSPAFVFAPFVTEYPVPPATPICSFPLYVLFEAVGTVINFDETVISFEITFSASSFAQI